MTAAGADFPRVVLVAGFEPFGGASVNPSAEVAWRLDGWRSADGAARVRSTVLPCEFGAARRALAEALRLTRPEVVIAFELAASRRELSVERVAVNLDDARIPDNAGAQPIDEPVVAGAPAAYFSTLPVKATVAAMRKAGVPAALSQTAGSFVCNHVFYALMHHIAVEAPRRRGGFIHLPPFDAVALQVQLEGAAVAVETVLAVQRDVRVAGGMVD